METDLVSYGCNYTYAILFLFFSSSIEQYFL